MTKLDAKGGPLDLAGLDRMDRAILAALTADGRISLTDLAARVGLSKTPVTARVRRMERDGIITGYSATLSWARLGLDHVAFVEGKLSDTRERQVPEVEQCHMIAGGYDYLLKVRTTDISAYRRVMGERISSLPHVASTSTYVAMEAVKDSSLLE